MFLLNSHNFYEGMMAGSFGGILREMMFVVQIRPKLMARRRPRIQTSNSSARFLLWGALASACVAVGSLLAGMVAAYTQPESISPQMLGCLSILGFIVPFGGFVTLLRSETFAKTFPKVSKFISPILDEMFGVKRPPRNRKRAAARVQLNGVIRKPKKKRTRRQGRNATSPKRRKRKVARKKKASKR